MENFDVHFPPVLRSLHLIEIEYGEGEGIDYEPFEEFQPAGENADWIRAWTGDKELTGSEYRIFGQDGTGGYAAFWLVGVGKDILEQPIVFFGSEGEKAVVAVDFADYLWLFANGVGPLEALDGLEYGLEDASPDAKFTAFATEHAPEAQKSAQEVLNRAQKAFPDFSANIDKLCRY